MLSLPALSTLLHHLFCYGEIGSLETQREWQAWVSLLLEVDLLQPIATDDYVARSGLYLLHQKSPQDQWRHLCFRLPAYRQYLLAILAQGLVSAGQVAGTDYRQRVSHWVSHDLAHLAVGLNQLLDMWENNHTRLIDRSAAEVAATFADWHQAHESFAEWDRVLLGRSGRPEDLFTAVLHHAIAFTYPAASQPGQERPITLLPPFTLTLDSSGSLALPPVAPWTRVRRQVYSSLPFYDEAERPLFDQRHSIVTIWQDMLAQQPYYRAILRLFIAARFSDYSGEALSVRVTDEWHTAQLYLEDRSRGALVDFWPELVEVMGYWPGTAVGPAELQQVLANWHKVEVLTGGQNGQLVLSETYARTLHEQRRAQSLLRGEARLEQERVNNFLKDSA